MITLAVMLPSDYIRQAYERLRHTGRFLLRAFSN